MDLYTMNENFISQSIVDEFISVIWTERYSTHGEVQLVTAATPSLITKLQEGTFLGLRGTKEVMQLETANIDDKVLTVTGKTLVSFLDQRLLWTKNPDSSAAAERIKDLVVNGKPGTEIANMVEDMVITTASLGGAYVDADLEWADEEIEFLTLGAVDASGDNVDMTFPVGPLYQAITQVAQEFGIGISLYLDSADLDSGFSLLFKTYIGDDHTTDGPEDLVRLTPAMESLSNIKELNSIQEYKNTCYVMYDGEISIHYEDPLNIQEGFQRRVLMTDAVGEPPGRKITWQFGRFPGETFSWEAPPSLETESEFRAKHAANALANYNYIRAIDGQTSPENEFQFGTDYGMGDIIELEGISGNIVKARVTEYIRSQDKNGEREYPTIAVVE